MRKLSMEGRAGTAGVVLGLLAVLAVGTGVVLFVVDTRQTAHLAVATAKASVASEQQLRDLILARCKQRTAYDQRFVHAAEGDEEFYADLLSIGERAEELRTTALTPAQRKLVDEQYEVIANARKRKAAIVAEGVLGNCDDYAVPPAH